MKYLILLILAAHMLFYNGANAQDKQTIRVHCFDTKLVFNELRKEYGEEPIIYGSGPENSKGIMTLWYSKTTGSWTIVVSNSDNTSCIIGGGTNLTAIQKEK